MNISTAREEGALTEMLTIQIRVVSSDFWGLGFVADDHFAVPIDVSFSHDYSVLACVGGREEMVQRVDELRRGGWR